MSALAEMTVVAHDRESLAAIPQERNVRILKSLSRHAAQAANLFVLTSLSDLAEVTELVREANKNHKLRALFIREDVDAKMLPQLLDLANLRILKNTLVHSGPEIPRRVMLAWHLGNTKELFATAHIAGSELVIITCALEVMRIEFDQMPSLNKIPVQDRASFSISDEGSYIHWPSQDIHLDLDAIRYFLDPKWRAEKDLSRLVRQRNFGKAVALLRHVHGLRQSDIKGLSARQVRRIESGGAVTLSALRFLASSHGMEFGEYMDEIANTMRIETLEESVNN